MALKYGDTIRIYNPDLGTYDFEVRETHWYNTGSSNYYAVYKLAYGCDSASGMCRFADSYYGYTSEWGRDFPEYHSCDYRAAEKLLRGIYQTMVSRFGKTGFYIKVNGTDYHGAEDGSLDPKFFKLKRQPIKLKTSL